MKIASLFLTGLAVLAVAPAAQAAAAPCDTDSAADTSLCRAGRPMPVLWTSVTSPKAGKPVQLYAGSDGRGVTFAWDLDGDGAYDDAAGDSVERAFAAGERTVGVRATDQFGRTGTETRSFLVTTVDVAPIVQIDIGPGKVAAGQPLNVTAVGTDYDGPPPRVELDLDDDGVYEYSSDDAELTRTVTFPSPGAHVVRARVADDDGATSRASATVGVGAAAGPAFTAMDLYPLISPDRSTLIRVEADKDAAFTLDLDGDGEFDDLAQPTVDGFEYTFTHPVTIAIKATTAAGSTIRTADVDPIAGNLGPQADLAAYRPDWKEGEPFLLAGRPLYVGYDVYADDLDYCCNIAWDSDGDGDYDVVGSDPPSFVPSVGVHSIGLRATDEHGAVGSVRDTFAIGTLPPRVRATIAGSTLKALANDPEGAAITSYAWDLDGDLDFDDATGPTAAALAGEHLVGVMAVDAGGDIGIDYERLTGVPAIVQTPSILPAPHPVPVPPFQVKTKVVAVKLAALRSHGLKVLAACTRACHTTVVASVDAKTAKRLKLGKRLEVGRGAGSGPAITVKLTAKARAALAKVRSVKLKVSFVTTGVGPGNMRVTTTKTVNVKRS